MSNFTSALISWAKTSVATTEDDILGYVTGKRADGSLYVDPDDPNFKAGTPADMTNPLSGLVLQEKFGGKQSPISAVSTMKKSDVDTTQSVIRNLGG